MTAWDNYFAWRCHTDVGGATAAAHLQACWQMARDVRLPRCRRICHPCLQSTAGAGQGPGCAHSSVRGGADTGTLRPNIRRNEFGTKRIVELGAVDDPISIAVNHRKHQLGRSGTAGARLRPSTRGCHLRHLVLLAPHQRWLTTLRWHHGAGSALWRWRRTVRGDNALLHGDDWDTATNRVHTPTWAGGNINAAPVATLGRRCCWGRCEEPLKPDAPRLGVQWGHVHRHCCCWGAG